MSAYATVRLAVEDVNQRIAEIKEKLKDKSLKTSEINELNTEKNRLAAVQSSLYDKLDYMD
jgi:hypothetical protein